MEKSHFFKNGDFNIHICKTEFSNNHSHSFFELAYVVSGNAIHNMSGDERKISAGDYFIMDHDKSHSYFKIGNGDFTLINCLFMPEFIDRSLKNCKNFTEVVNNYMLKHNHTSVNVSPANYIFSDKSGYILSLLERMLEEYSTSLPGYHEVIRSKLIEIIILTMRMHSKALPVCTDELCSKVIAFASENMGRRDILSHFSKELNLSVAYLSSKFKSVMGMPFSEYIKKIRVEQSLHLLANTNKKVIEIAQLCGYSDIKFFNRTFKEQTGFTPREFRKTI